MIPEPLFEPVHFQQELDTLRKKVNCDFAAVALYENHEPSGPIKWQYVFFHFLARKLFFSSSDVDTFFLVFQFAAKYLEV